jgi:hypothetical protein
MRAEAILIVTRIPILAGALGSYMLERNNLGMLFLGMYLGIAFTHIVAKRYGDIYVSPNR